jgi:hypothetical protein
LAKGSAWTGAGPLPRLPAACYTADVSDILATPDSTSKRRRRLRLIGLTVLFLGLGGAWLLYWIRTRTPDVMKDPSMVGFYKAQTRQMGELFGRMGLVTEQLSEELKQPGTQAKLVVAVSVLVALGCFYFSSLPSEEDEGTDD